MIDHREQIPTTLKALTIGGAMIDTIATIDDAGIERLSLLNADKSFLLLEQGKKTEAAEISSHCGGGAANAAVAFSRLGFQTTALVKLGTDTRAELVLHKLNLEHVSTLYVQRTADMPTGASVLISSHGANAAVFTFRGANTLLAAEDLRDEAFDVDVTYISNLSNDAALCFEPAIEKAKAKGSFVAANPGIRQIAAHGGAIERSLSKLDILAINRREADGLVPLLARRFGEGGDTLHMTPNTRPPRLALRGLAGDGYEMSLASFFRALTRHGTDCILLTDGSEGAFVATHDEILFCAAPEIPIAGTAGAGDAFAATYTAYAAARRPAEEALRAATLNASSVLGHIDTQTGLLQRQALQQKIDNEDVAPELMRWRL